MDRTKKTIKKSKSATPDPATFSEGDLVRVPAASGSGLLFAFIIPSTQACPPSHLHVTTEIGDNVFVRQEEVCDIDDGPPPLCLYCHELIVDYPLTPSILCSTCSSRKLSYGRIHEFSDCVHGLKIRWQQFGKGQFHGIVVRAFSSERILCLFQDRDFAEIKMAHLTKVLGVEAPGIHPTCVADFSPLGHSSWPPSISPQPPVRTLSKSGARSFDAHAAKAIQQALDTPSRLSPLVLRYDDSDDSGKPSPPASVDFSEFDSLLTAHRVLKADFDKLLAAHDALTRSVDHKLLAQQKFFNTQISALAYQIKALTVPLPLSSQIPESTNSGSPQASADFSPCPAPALPTALPSSQRRPSTFEFVKSGGAPATFREDLMALAKTVGKNRNFEPSGHFKISFADGILYFDSHGKIGSAGAYEFFNFGSSEPLYAPVLAWVSASRRKPTSAAKPLPQVSTQPPSQPLVQVPHSALPNSALTSSAPPRASAQLKPHAARTSAPPAQKGTSMLTSGSTKFSSHVVISGVPTTFPTQSLVDLITKLGLSCLPFETGRLYSLRRTQCRSVFFEIVPSQGQSLKSSIDMLFTDLSWLPSNFRIEKSYPKHIRQAVKNDSRLMSFLDSLPGASTLSDLERIKSDARALLSSSRFAKPGAKKGSKP